MPPSHHPALLPTATAIGTIFLGFGLAFTYNPRSALPFFEFAIPASAADAALADSLITLYAVRDIFMGVAIYAAAYFKERRTLGVLLVAGGLVAGADGVVVKGLIGRGEWNHWGYAPVLVLVGAVLSGVVD